MKSFFFSKCFSLIGFLMILAAIGLYFMSDYMIRFQVFRNILLEKNSKAFQSWLHPPAKILREYYFFDVLNPSEIESGIAKPQVIQRGPYVYSEVWEKKNANFLDQDTLRFSPVITIHFEPSLSNGTEDDLITFLNIPAVSMIESLMNAQTNAFSVLGINLMFKMLQTKLFVTKTVGQLISGYDDPLMKMASIIMPNQVKNGQFSILNGRNGTAWQNFTINTGKSKAQNVGKVKSWNDLKSLNFWDSETANMINGTDGSVYGPFRTKDQVLYSFNSGMCRSYRMEYLKDNVIKGIKTFDFHLPKYMFYNTTYNPDNIGFCGKDNKCFANGVQNISKCYTGASAFISLPHFLNAEPGVFENMIDGLKPEESLHDFILHFEPTTGVPISGNIRLQISFYVQQFSQIDLVKNIKPTMIPVFWFDDSVELYENTRNQLAQVAFIALLCLYIPFVVLCLGGLWVVSSICFYIYAKYHQIPADYEVINGTESKEETNSITDTGYQNNDKSRLI